MSDFAVATWNIGDTGKSTDLIAAAEAASVVCLQEASDRDVMLRAFVQANRGWVVLHLTEPGGPADPVMVDTAAHGVVKVTPHPGVESRWVGKGKLTRRGWTGKGPRISKPKPIMEVELDNGVHVFNLHMIASVTKTEAVLGTRTYRARRRHFADMVSALLAAVRTVPADHDVVVTGDFNCDETFALMAPLLAAGFVGWTQEGTHAGDRPIDHVAFLKDRGLTRTSTEVTRTSSDHKRVVAGFTIEQETAVPTITQKVVRNARERGLTVLTREEWGSNPDGRRWAKAPDVNNVYAWRRDHKPVTTVRADTVVQHITVTLDHGPLTGDFKTDVQTVERIGFDRFGSGVSYNWVVDMATGMIAVGQPLDAKGTHTINDRGVPGYSYDQNAVARAIAVLGMPDDRLSDAAELAIATLIAAMIDEGACTNHFDYDPHSKFAAKDCPCDSTRDKMPAIRKKALELVSA